MASIAPSTAAVTPDQRTRLILIGLALWVVGVLAIRLLGPIGGLRGLPLVLLYAATALTMVPTLIACRRLAGLAPEQTLAGVALMTAVAIPLDGIAMAWFPWIYGVDTATILAGAGWLLWFIGLSFIAALRFNRG